MSFEADDHDRDSRKVEDVADLNKRERLAAVHRQWLAARDAGIEAEKAWKLEHADKTKCQALYRIELCALLRELVALGRSTDEDSVWWTAELGAVENPIPEVVNEAFGKLSNGTAGFSGRLLSSPPKPYRKQIAGLEGYLTTDWDDLTAQFGFRYGTPHNPNYFPPRPNYPLVVGVEPSFAMSHRVLEYSRQFMKEHELDFGFDEGRPFASYSND